jgi:hypothetical protein
MGDISGGEADDGEMAKMLIQRRSRMAVLISDACHGIDAARG